MILDSKQEEQILDTMAEGIPRILSVNEGETN
jgi:hypothetical protein